MFGLVVDGKSESVIVIDATAKGTIPLAAAQFQAYVRRMSGAELPIEPVGEDAARLTDLLARRLVVLGESAVARRLGIDMAGVGTDGFLTRATPKYLAIVGRDDTTRAWGGNKDPIESGTMHGVFAFLRGQGVRTFFEQEELDVIPHRTTIRVPLGETRDAPFFPFRWGYSGRQAWGLKVGFGGAVDPWESRHSFGHNLTWSRDTIAMDGQEVPLNWHARYWETHPEWFAQSANGRRTPHLRFTLPDVQDQIVRDAAAWFAKGGNYYTLLQNDGYTNIDQSPETQSRIRHDMGYYGFLSDATMAPFIKIARRLEKTHPNRKVALGAYHGYSRPPRDAEVLPRNATIMLNRHRLNNIVPRRRQDNRMLLDEWLPLKPSEVYLWEYYCYGRRPWFGEGYELYPRFLPHAIAEDVAYLAEVRKLHPGFKGEWLFFEYRRDGANTWWQFPNAYLTARLFWDPRQDIDALLVDYYATAFGPAAGEMEAFYTLCEETWATGAPELLATHAAPYQSTGAVKTNRAMGHHFLDVHLTPTDFDRVWTPKVRGRLAAHLERAAELSVGTDAAKRVAFVRRGYGVFADGGYRFRSGSLELLLDAGHVIALINPATDTRHQQVDRPRSRIPLLQIQVKGKKYAPQRMGWNPETGTTELGFRSVTAEVRIIEQSECLVLELVALRDKGGIVESVIWGPYRTTLSPDGGDLVAGGDYALGLVPLGNTVPGLRAEPGQEVAPWMRRAAIGGKGKGYLAAHAAGAFAGSRIALAGGTPAQIRSLSAKLRKAPEPVGKIKPGQ